MKIAVLDDDLNHLKLVESVLRGGHSVLGVEPSCVYFSSGQEMMSAVRREPFDVLILDRQVPDMSGDVILQWVRQYAAEKYGIYTLVIMLTNLSDPDNELYSLKSGADDYIAKPFAPEHLLWRIRRLWEVRASERRIRPQKEVGKYQLVDLSQKPIVTLKGYTFSVVTLIVSFDERQLVKLTQLEFSLALFLLSNMGTPIPRDDFWRYVWLRGSDQPQPNHRTLDTHLHRLRTKLQLNEARGFSLRTVYGFGYRLDVVDGVLERVTKLISDE